MIENSRSGCFAGKGARRDNVCVDSMQILDSCRDKDYFEDVRVFLTDFGQDIIEKTGNIKVKDANIMCVNVQADPVRFNCGFYQIVLRTYTRLMCEACLCPGKPQEFEGVAVTEKKVVLYGGDGCVKVFRTTPAEDGFCSVPCSNHEEGNNKPTVVVETLDPVPLSVKVKERCRCNCCGCGCVEEVPQTVCDRLGGCLVDHQGLEKVLTVSLGFFSVVRIERPGQFILQAEDYCVPDKICKPSDEEDPSSTFAKMAFPTAQFCPASGGSRSGTGDCGCGCGNGCGK
ncbi:MAG: hypothetical protein IJU52_05500 [Clostridia bacterium]|nr:hypothetical protein [Clostridia bacterium]